MIAQSAGVEHLGPATCASRGCHGGSQPGENGLRVDGNEHAVWLNGPHATAYRTLQTDKAAQIARNLGFASASTSPFCLGCHATAVETGLRGAEFRIQDGVTCEACHGGAGLYYDEHQTGLSRARLTELGMIPTEDPVRRAEMCLNCHFGAEDQFAGHKLMGAGHPRLSFELDSYSEGETVVHHTVDDDYLERKPETVGGMRTWAIGQAVTTRRRMALLASERTGRIGFFPEFVFFDCHSCHQPMSVKRRASVNKRGHPKLDDAHMEMLRIAMRFSEPALSDRVAGETRALHKAAAQSRGAMVGAARRLESVADAALESLARRGYTGADRREILKTLSASGAGGRFAEFATAEQTVMAIGTTIYAMWSADDIGDAEYDRLNAVLAEVLVTVDDDDSYDPRRFAGAMSKFNAALQ